jgi:hypothetical protein
VKYALTLVFVVIWFFYLIAGAGAGFACWRIWPDRTDKFTRRLIIFLHGLMIDALLAIVLVFLARGVKFTWKFTIAIFVAALIKSVVSLPLLLLLMRGFDDKPGIGKELS